MTVRVVVYAEGAGETAGELPLPNKPAAGLIDAHLGAVHHLVRRTVASVHRVDERAVQFEAPLRVRTRIARGSDLLVRGTIRTLLTWANSDQRPHLAVVLVDADGSTTRRADLHAHLDGLATRAIAVVGVALQEFESWLIADAKAATDACGVTIVQRENIESMARTEAKTVLATATSAARSTIAQHADLEALRRRLPSFARFCDDVAAVGVPGSRR